MLVLDYMKRGKSQNDFKAIRCVDRLFLRAKQYGILKGFFVGRGKSMVTYLQFTNNAVFLFLKPQSRWLVNLQACSLDFWVCPRVED